MKKNVLVTGASTGIGEQTTLDLTRAGFHVFAGVRKVQDGEKLKAKDPQNITPIEIDVTKPAQVKAAFDLIKTKGPLWGLVNNAGIVVAGPMEYLTTQDLREQFEVNVFGLHEVTHTFLPLIRQSKGRIVHISSISGRFAFPFVGPYAASKFAVEGMGDSLRREIAPHGVKVSIVLPGRVSTPIWDKSQASNGARREKLSPLAGKHYGVPLETLRRLTSKGGSFGVPATRVSSAVVQALKSKCPKRRYIVGMDAKVQDMMNRFLPASFCDWIISKILKW